MTNGAVAVDCFDEWLAEESAVAALVMRQWLQPVEGKDAIVFPPTYAKPERVREEDWLAYNIDRFDDGSSVCLIDSVGSQANRMEPVFKRPSYSDLVPQVTVEVGAEMVNLLDVGHRAADAVVRFSSLKETLEEAFKSLERGDAEPLAALAPTSLVFGAWDSRGTQVKIPRILRSVILAFDVRPLHRSAQYIPAVDYVGAGLVDAPQTKADQDRLSELGLSHAPASWTHGGVQVLGEIRRDALLSLAALRTLAAKTPDRTLLLRRYILGLALVSFTAPLEVVLRQGCELVADPDRPTVWQLVRHDGSREPFALNHADAVIYAQGAAKSFGVEEKERSERFDAQSAKGELAKSKKERKRSRRSPGAGETSHAENPE